MSLFISHILTPTPTPGACMSMKCEQPLNEVTVQIWSLYNYPNFKYCTLSVSWTELRTKRTDRRTIWLLDAPADLSGRGIKRIVMRAGICPSNELALKVSIFIWIQAQMLNSYSTHATIYAKNHCNRETSENTIFIKGCAGTVQWNLSKPILIRTKEKYRFRQVIGLDRLIFTSLGNIVYQNLKYLHSTKHKIYFKIIMLFIVVWICKASAIKLISI